MNKNYYRWECWHNRPKFEKVRVNWKAKTLIKWKIVAFFLLIWIYFLEFLIQIIYFLTLPFAFVNEFLRDF